MSIKLEPSGKPLYQRIHDAVRDKIASGEWSAGFTLPTRRAIAEDLNTTTETVAKALGELIRDGWIAASAGSGTYVTALGGKLAIDAGRVEVKTGPLRIGVEYPFSIRMDDKSNLIEGDPYYGEMLQGIRSAVEPDVVTLSLGVLDAAGGVPSQAELDGFVVVTPTTSSMLKLRAGCGGKPYVVVGSSGVAFDPERYAGIPLVDTTHRQGSYDAVRHLIELGHTRIAVVNCRLAGNTHYERLQGCLSAVADAGLYIAPQDLILFPDRDSAAMDNLLEMRFDECLSSHRLPTAIFACDLADGLMTFAGLRRHGIAIPDDISLICYDDSIVFEHTTPPITAVRQPVFEMGRRATERLLACLRNGEPIQDTAGTELIPTQLIMRASTGRPRE
jgi:DNA-binding LacI/PurR family transcriptional regulator/DNA-binding transcriptional regulator YhcF (GntR family)